MPKHMKICLVLIITFISTIGFAYNSATKTCVICLTNEIENDEITCNDCLFFYVKNKIESGYIFIVKVKYNKLKKLYDYDDIDMEGTRAIRNKYYYDEEFIVKTIHHDDVLMAKYAKNKADFRDRRKGLKPCVNARCDGKLKRPEIGKSQCDLCGALYVVEYLGKEVRYCPTCEAPICLKDGCDDLFCVACASEVSWSRAKKGSPPPKNAKPAKKKDTCVIF